MKKLYTFIRNQVERKNGLTKAFASLTMLVLLGTQVLAQTPYPMQDGNYSEDFANILNWTNLYASSGAEVVPNHSHWGVAAAPLTVSTGGPLITNNTVFTTSGTSGGIQRGGQFGNPAGTLVLLQTGGTDGTNAGATDLYLDFRNRVAGNITFNWQTVFNSTGNRNLTLRVFGLNNAGTQFDQIGTDIQITNNVAGSGTFGPVALPSHFNYKANTRIRFYVINQTGGSSGSRPKIAIDNLSITSTPCTATKLVVTSVNAGNCPVVGVPFSTVVQSQSADNNACAVTANTNLSLSVNTGSGSLSGTTTGSLTAATFQNTFTFTGLTYDAAETGVSLNIARTSGDALTAGNSSPFEVIATTAAEPTIQGSISPAPAAFNSVALTLTPGNGLNRVVVAKAGSAVTTAPADGVPYTANAFFGSGSTTTTGEFVVYNGNGSNVTVTGLSQGTTYHFAVFEFNGTGCALNYLPSLSGASSATTPVQSLVAGDISFLQTRGDSPDGFSFVALTDIAGGTRIRFTDASWIGDATNGPTGDKFLTSENAHYMWTSPISTSGITAGTVVNLQGSSASVGTLTDTLGGGGPTITGISDNGDQVFAYTGARTRPQVNLIAGITTAPFITVGVASAGNSYRPGALTGNLAIELTSAVDDNGYMSVPSVCGTPATLRSIFADQNNWFRYETVVPTVQDFQPTTYWSINIVGALAAEPTTSATVAAVSPQSSSITLNLGSGDGTGRLVVAKLTSNATNSVPTDGVIYTSNLAYGTSGTELGAGSGNFVVYSGTNPVVAVTSLSPLTSYTFTVYEYNNVPCVNYKTSAPGVSSNTTDVIRYYSKSAQKTNLENLSAWSVTPNEAGAAPADFTTPGVFFVVDDNGSTIGAPWSVGGASTRIFVNPGASLTIPAANVLTTAGGSGINVRSNATLTLENAALPTLSSIDSTGSTVNFNMFGTVTIPAFSYYNLGLRNGVKAFPVGSGVNGQERLDNTIRVKGNLIVDGTTLDPAGAPFSFLSVHGNVTSLNSSIWGSLSDGLTLTFRGITNQTFSKVGGGPNITLFKIAANKVQGNLTFAAGNDIAVNQDFEFAMSNSTKFFDGGNTFDVGDDLRLDGAASNYVLTGTFNMTGTTLGEQHNIENSANNATSAQLNNLIVSTPNATDQVRFNPSSGTSTITVKGNINISTANAVLRPYDNIVAIGGNFVNNSSSAGSFLHGASTLAFNGSAAQTIQTTVPLETYHSLRIDNNTGGVTFINPFEMTGNLTNNGVVGFSGNAVTFSGTVAQNLGGSKRTTFGDLNLNNSAGGSVVSATGKVSVTGTVNFGANADLTITPGGDFRLVSNGTGTARIAQTAPGTVITGNITAERFIANSGWHFTGTALAGQTITDWNDDLQTTGPMPGVEVYNPGSNTSMIFEYDQSSSLTDGLAQLNGWLVPTSSNIVQNRGYRVWTPANSTLDNSGSYAVGTKTLTLASTGSNSYAGYNLLVNPHLSAVDRAAFTLGGGVQNTVIIWNQGSGYQYVGPTAMSGATLNNGLNPIASGQGFFMYTTTNGATVDIPESAKIAGGTFFRTNSAQNAPEIQLRNSAGKMDASVFQFINDAQGGYDTYYDAHKMMNDEFNVYTLNQDGNKLALNGLPFQGEQMVIPMGFQAGQGQLSLTFTGLALANGVSQVYLKDNETGMLIDLNQNPVYSFNNAQAGENNSRFELIFTNSVTSLKSMSAQSEIQIFPNPVQSGSFLLKSSALEGQVQVEILDVLGRIVYTSSTTDQSLAQGIRIASPAVKGQYMIRVKAETTSFVKSLIVK